MFQGDITSKEDVRKIFISHQIDVVFNSASYGMSGREQVSMLYLLSERWDQTKIHLPSGFGFKDIHSLDSVPVPNVLIER